VAPYVFISPFLVLFAVFGLFPLLFSLYAGLPAWEPTSGLGRCSFVGLDNFAFALAGRVVLEVAEEHAVAGGCSRRAAAPGGHPAGGVHPHLLQAPARRRGRRLLPALHHEHGGHRHPVQLAVLHRLRPDQRGMLSEALAGWYLLPAARSTGSNPENIKPAIAFIVFWRYVGFNVVLYLAALQTIPRTCTKPPRWTAPAAGSSSSTSPCRA
jgi:multiple sugar transport system permease protein